MASKVMMKIPVAPFAQVSKSKSPGVNGDLVPMKQSEINNHSNIDTQRTSDSRVAQLEQNIKFLQEQHQLMLAGLHKEIDNLRHKNRDLQFQIVFMKGSSPTSPSSPEDDTKTKVYTSPKQVNITPLQVEILEKELGELKLNLQEIESQNVYLSAIADEQKKKLERYERDRERERERGLQSDPELLRKLEDAESVIRRLRQENSELRRENSPAIPNPPNTYHHNRDNNFQNQRNPSNGRGNSRYRGNFRGNWFPPLQSQSYWHNNRGGERGGGNQGENTTLPRLQSDVGSSSGQFQGNSRRGANNNHYHNGDGRKYRNNQNRSHKPS